MSSDERKVIATNAAPAAIGPYAQANHVCKYVWTSGQIPLDPATGEIVGATIEEQTERAIKNLEAVLLAGGSSLALTVKTTVFLSDMNNFAAMNEVYAKFFAGDMLPSRSCVEVSRLPKDVLVEIEAVGISPKNKADA
jgi:2-iminobutanoate/2-iminopropanoate deaminase